MAWGYAPGGVAELDRAQALEIYGMWSRIPGGDEGSAGVNPAFEMAGAKNRVRCL